MKMICLLFWLAIPAVVQGQAADASGQRPFAAVSGAFFALSVADLESSATWYSEKLGLDVVMEVPKADGPGVIVLEGGGLTVELIEHEGAVPLSQAAPAVADAQFIHGIFKVGFEVEDFDRTVASLRERGVEIVLGPFPARADQRANVLIRDNSGNLIQIFGR